MCAQYTIQASSQTLENASGIKLKSSFQYVLNKRVTPSIEVPVYVYNPAQKIFQFPKMRYGLVPSWSKTAKPEFATYNARIETVLTKPTWKVPFEKQHCLVVMTSFVEAVYEGPYAGHMIEFRFKEPFFVAGVFDYWQATEPFKVDESGFYSFALLTTEASEAIRKAGHDRSPIFVSSEAGKIWLQGPAQGLSSTVMLEFLQDSLLEPKFEIHIERALKAGWENRK